MQARIRKYITGYLKIQITGYSPERFFNMCSHHNIDLWNLTSHGTTYEMNISVHDFRKLKPIIRKTKTKVKVTERSGFPFFLQEYKKRQIFVIGLVLCAIFLFFMTTFIWNIQINGNYKYSEEEIEKDLRNQHIYIGQMKKKIHCDEISSYLRKKYSDIIWVSASVEGICLKIQIKENMDQIYQQDTVTKEAPSNLIAAKDGIITDIITRQGMPLVHIGDAVKEGDCLVSGNIPVYNDAKEIIGYKYAASDADIIAQTEYQYEEILPLEHDVIVETGKKKWRIWLGTSHRRFYFGNNSFSTPCYKILENEKQIMIGKRLKIPISFGIIEYRECESTKETYSEREANLLLSENFQRFCKSLEKKGVQILQNSVKIYTGVERTTAKGVLILHEEIGNPVTVEQESVTSIEEKLEE